MLPRKLLPSNGYAEITSWLTTNYPFSLPHIAGTTAKEQSMPRRVSDIDLYVHTSLAQSAAARPSIQNFPRVRGAQPHEADEASMAAAILTASCHVRACVRACVRAGVYLCISEGKAVVRADG